MGYLSFTTTKNNGNVRAPGRLERFLKSKKLPASFACGEQVHEARIVSVYSLTKQKKYPRVDGLLTDAPGQPLAIFTADCAPVFLTANKGEVVGLVHAGWRGVKKQIFPKAVRLIWKKWGIPARQVSAWAGPHIGACCFEVQKDVARHFPASRKKSGDRWKVDLEAELARQARRLGVRWTSKKGSGGCTMHGGRYYSYRKDKTDKRQVSVIVKV